MKSSFRHIIVTLGALLCLLCAPAALTSCINDSMTTSPSDLLTFSRDTVSFDTVFTDLGTPTARLIVLNKAKKGINISSIRFKNPDTYFRMNVDGQSGSEFHDVEIRSKDSIYVFVECNIPETSGNEPRLVEDELLFITNGVTQSVLLEAWGQNVTRLRAVTLDGDMRLTADRPYVVFDSLVVPETHTLTVDPGARILFHDKAYLRVNGRLEAVGTADRKIDFRGDRLDNVLPDVGYDIMAGQWKGVYIGKASFGNRMEYVNMRSTSDGLRLDSCGNVTDTKITLYNSWLHNSQSNVLRAPYCKVEATGCCFSEAADEVVNLSGGDFRFLQCTFANNYLFSAISGPLVGLNHILPDAKNNTASADPLMKASFENCILYGIPADINCETLEGSNVFFRTCSLKSPGENDNNFINCLWDTDPLFLTIREDYIFNYRLSEESPVIHSADPAYLTLPARTDMDGVNRLRDGNPSLGAYQYIPPAD